LFPSNGIAHEDLTLPGVEDEDAPVAAPEERAVVGVGVGAAIVDPHGEPAAGYAVGRVEDGGERDPSAALLEEPEEGRLPVARAEAEEEFGVRGEAAPPLADEGDAGQGGGQRGEAEEDLPEDVVTLGRGAGTLPAARLVAVLGHAGSRITGVGETHER
jgi:hypothetical protein